MNKKNKVNKFDVGKKLWELPYGIEDYINKNEFRLHDKYYVTHDGEIWYEDTEGNIRKVESYMKRNKRCVEIYGNEYILAEVLLHIQVGKIELPIKCIDWKNPIMSDVKYELSIEDVIKSEDKKSVFIKGIEFKNVPGFDIYYISNTGIVYSEYKNNLIRHSLNHASYHRIGLYNGNNNKKILSRVVYETWRGPIPKGYEMDHLYSKALNGINDIELVSSEENKRRAWLSGCLSGKWDKYVVDICEMSQNGMRPCEIAIKLGFSPEHPEYKNMTELIYGIRSGKAYSQISKEYRFPPVSTGMFSSITIDQAHEISHLLETTSLSQKEISCKLNVSRSNVSRIKNKHIFRDISDKYDFSDRISYPSELINKICQYLQDYPKMPLKEIAKKCNVNKSIISDIKTRKSHKNISKNYDFSKRKDDRRIYSDDKVHEICKILQDTNMSYDQIADECGVSAGYVVSLFSGKVRVDISHVYDFSNRIKYNKSKMHDEKLIHKICKLLQNHTELTIKEISEMCNVSTTYIRDIKTRKIHKNISKNYDFSKRMDSCPDKLIHKICKLLQNHTELTIKEISEMCNVSAQTVYAIKNKKSRIKISNQYDFSARIKMKNRIGG